MFLKITQLESFKIRNNIVLKNVIPELGKKYFTKSPFVNSYYGLANPLLYIYEMCRLVDCQYIEFITIYISKRNSYIQIYLNIFELSPSLNDIYQLKNIDGLNFHLLPNNKKRARLDMDLLHTIPLFSKRFMFDYYKLHTAWSKKGMERQIEKLKRRLEKDISNIENFIDKWFSIYTPNITQWNGEVIKER